MLSPAFFWVILKVLDEYCIAEFRVVLEDAPAIGAGSPRERSDSGLRRKVRCPLIGFRL